MLTGYTKPAYLCAAAFVSVAAFVSLDLFRSAPKAEWKSIRNGMKLELVVEQLGTPTHDLVGSKGIQIWIRKGLIRSSSFAVFYYDRSNPHVVTGSQEGMRWINERL